MNTVSRMQVTKVIIRGDVLDGAAAYKRARAGDGVLQSLAREGRVAYDLYGHPNVLSILGRVQDSSSGTSTGLLYEICDCDLRAVLRAKRGRLHSAQVHRVLQQLLSATVHLNRHGLVHGDVKPDNALVTVIPGARAFDVKLGDFGVCTEIGGVRQGGSPKYMSPECLDNWFDPAKRSPADIRDDVFSIAVLALEMLSPASMSEALGGRQGIVACIREGSLLRNMQRRAGLKCEPELLRVLQWCMLPLAARPLPCEVLAYLKAHTASAADGSVRWHSDTPDPQHVERVDMNIMVSSRLRLLC
jgi:serine/threonine protein kinase